MSKRKLKKIIKQLKGSAKMHKVQANALEKMSVAEEDNPRIPRKKGQPAGSKKHSDLYTDENPKGTIKGLGFKTPSDARSSVTKIRKSGRSKAHKTQAAVSMEQRARVMGKIKAASVYRKFIDSNKKKSVSEDNLDEDLRKWVKQRWGDIGAPKKGGGFKPCGRSKGEKRRGYPKCVPAAKAASMSKGQRRSAVSRKRAAGNPGGKPTNVKTFTKRSKNMNEGKLCPRGKAAAKSKFKVYPSAYANMYASAVCSGKVTPGGKKKNESVYHTIGKMIAEKRCWKGYRRKKGAAPYSKGSCVKVSEAKSPAWQRSEGKNPEGGLNKKGVASYRAANPGSKLKTAVTTKPSKLKKGSKSAKRRKSFCARMGGMKKRLTSAKTANDPNSRINKALRKWNC